jgi:putative peptidoglycan lipid II flippase
MMIAAPWIIDTFYAASVDGNPELQQTMIDLLRILLITPVLFGAGGVITATLHTRQQFLWPSIAPIVYNLGLIVGIIVFAPDVLGVGYGAVVGALGYFLIQIPGLRPLGARYRPIIRAGDGGVKQVIVLMLPRMLGLSFSFLNLAIIPYVAQTMENGSVRALQLAYRLMLLPSAVFGQALGIASFPTFSTLAAQNQLPEMRRILADTLRLIVFLGLPITVGMVVVRQPLIAMLFQRGEFGYEATTYTAWALLFFALALVALAGIEVVARAFYAMKDTVTPVLLGILQLILMYVLSIWLGQTFFPALGWLSFGGVALGFSIANWLELTALLLLLRRKMHGIGGRRLWSGVWRMGVAATVMAVVMGIVHQQFLPGIDGSFWQYLWAVLVPSAVGGLVYLVLCQLLKVDELQAILGIVTRRLRR